MRAWLARFFRPETGIFLGFVVIFLLFGRTRFFQDPGTYWHIVLGRNLMATGEFTQADAFTFTFSGQAWLALQWLGELAMAWIYQLGGWDLLLLAAVTFLATLYTWVASRLLRDGLHWLPTVLLLVVVIGASSHHFHVRPHLASIACLAFTFGLLVDVENGRRRPQQLAWLIPLFLVWTNVHGAVLAGWATVGLAVIGWAAAHLFAKLRGKGERSPWQTRGLLAVALVVPCLGLTFLVNPYGLDAPLAWLRIMSMPLPELIDEHRALSLRTPEGVMTIILSGIYLYCLADAIRQKRRFVWFIPLVWMLLAFSRVRHAPLFAVIAPLAIADILPHTRLSRRLAETECFLPAQPRPTWAFCLQAALLPAALILFSLTCQFCHLAYPLVGRGWAHPGPHRWPSGLLAQLEQLSQENDQRPRIFNDLDFGGYLNLHAPRWQTFIDDRCELFGAEFLKQYLDAHEDPTRIDAWSQNYGFEVALIRSGSNMDHYLMASPRWKLVGQDEAASLYVRQQEHAPHAQIGGDFSLRAANEFAPTDAEKFRLESGKTQHSEPVADSAKK